MGGGGKGEKKGNSGTSGTKRLKMDSWEINRWAVFIGWERATVIDVWIYQLQNKHTFLPPTHTHISFPPSFPCPLPTLVFLTTILVSSRPFRVLTPSCLHITLFISFKLSSFQRLPNFSRLLLYTHLYITLFFLSRSTLLGFLNSISCIISSFPLVLSLTF
jgi:hypothetical protein